MERIELIENPVEHLIRNIQDIYSVVKEYRLILRDDTYEFKLEYNYKGIARALIKTLKRNIVYSVDLIVNLCMDYLPMHTKENVDIEKWKKIFLYESYIAAMEIEEYNYIDDLFIGNFNDIKFFQNTYKLDNVILVYEPDNDNDNDNNNDNGIDNIKKLSELLKTKKNNAFFIAFVKISDNFGRYVKDKMYEQFKDIPLILDLESNKKNIDYFLRYGLDNSYEELHYIKPLLSEQAEEDDECDDYDDDDLIGEDNE